MKLNLSLFYQEQNDNKAILLQDTTNNFGVFGNTLVEGNEMLAGQMYQIIGQQTYNFAGDPNTLSGSNLANTRFVVKSDAVGPDLILGFGDSLKEVTPTIAEINGATLDTIFEGVDKTEIPKDSIDLYAEFGGPWSGQGLMAYVITSELLGDAPDALLPDGLYEMVYTLNYKGSPGSTFERSDPLDITLLVYGQVKALVYEKIRHIPTLYMCDGGAALQEILEADLCGAYLSGIEQSAFLAKTEELLNMLIVLEDMVKNGSGITY